MRASVDRPRLPLLALLAVLPVVMGGCKSTPPEPNVRLSEGVEIRALIYSGRENPAVRLDAARTEELRTLALSLKEIPGYEGGSITPSILGYAGLVVINGTQAGGLPDFAAVYDGKAQLNFADRTLYLADPDGVLESWLLERLIQGKVLSEEELRVIRGG